jgi:UDP-N-acetylmuramoyl-tripeptide--D-alanyl-D-alanine ligase
VRSKSGALILDDTYNASPQSTLAALNLLEELEGRKVAVLGDMLELGQYEQQGHEMVGYRAAEVVDELICIGEKAKMIAEAARRSGMPESSIRTLLDKQDVIDYLLPRMDADDVILVKGSRGARLDQVVGALEYRK